MQLILHLTSAVRLPTGPWRALARARRSVIAVTLSFCVSLGLAVPGAKAHAVSPAPTKAQVVTPLDSSFAFADFDGDHRPDLATAEVEHSDAHLTRYLIRLQLNSRGPGSRQAIGLTGSFGVPQISALDVNGDNVPDLVVTASGQQRLIAVLLNDGRGRFSVANPRDFAFFLADSPWRWRSASGHVQDIAVLVLAQSPQAEAARERDTSASQVPGTHSVSLHPGFVTDAKGSAPSGRAPPLFS